MSKDEGAATIGVLVYITAPTLQDAARLGRLLVEARLGACANIVPTIRSIYRWDGQIQDESEALLLVKTTAAAVDRLMQAVREAHPYKMPAISVVPLVRGNPDYMRWLAEEVAP